MSSRSSPLNPPDQDPTPIDPPHHPESSEIKPQPSTRTLPSPTETPRSSSRMMTLTKMTSTQSLRRPHESKTRALWPPPLPPHLLTVSAPKTRILAHA
ncbi:NmrA domain-containing protein [Psidium guajava]|nr:NmrA domain-containing protein [Psidium guajava]